MSINVSSLGIKLYYTMGWNRVILSSLDKGHRKMPGGEKNNFHREEQREEHLNWTFSKGRASAGTVGGTVVSGGAGGTVQNTGEAVLMMRPNAQVHSHLQPTSF